MVRRPRALAASALTVGLAATLTLTGSPALAQASPTPEPSTSTPAPTTSAPEPEPSTSEPTPEPTQSSEPAEEPTEPAPRETAKAEQQDLATTSISLTPSIQTVVRQQLAWGTATVKVDGASAKGVLVKFTGTVGSKAIPTKSARTNASGQVSYGYRDLPATGVMKMQAHVVADKTYAASSSAPRATRVQTGRYVSFFVNSGGDATVLGRENFWLRGRVFRGSGAAESGVPVSIYRYSGSTRTKVASLRTTSAGFFTWSPTWRTPGTYRAIVSSARYSSTVTVRPASGTRTLEERAESLQFLLGAAKSGVGSRNGYRYRLYAHGWVVTDGARAYVVRGAAYGELNRSGGPGGKISSPTMDARCNLPEGACLQTFRKGAIYVNPNARDKVTSAFASTYGAADLVAVAKSQAGYTEPAYRKGKYSRWMGRTGAKDAWCGYFTAWLGYAARKPNAVVKRTTFAAQAKAERSRGRTSKSPAVGRLAYFRFFGSFNESHTGIVAKYDSKYVWSYEGNVSKPGGIGYPRGVFLVKRLRSQAVFYADPYY